MVYKVAVTSSSGETVDMHFGHAREFLIFEVDVRTGEYNLVKSCSAEAEEIGPTGGREPVNTLNGADTPAKDILPNECLCSSNAADDTWLARVTLLLDECEYLLTARIGMRPYKALFQKGINALEAPYPIPYALEQLNRYYAKRHGIDKD